MGNQHPESGGSVSSYSITVLLDIIITILDGVQSPLVPLFYFLYLLFFWALPSFLLSGQDNIIVAT